MSTQEEPAMRRIKIKPGRAVRLLSHSEYVGVMFVDEIQVTLLPRYLHVCGFINGYLVSTVWLVRPALIKFGKIEYHT